MNELSPQQTAKLAEGVYTLNKNDELSPEVFLGNQLFKKNSANKPKVINAEVGPPDTVASGGGTVLRSNKPAARMRDSSGHGGKIVLGCKTVLIGG